MTEKKGYTRTYIEEATNDQLIELLERTAMHYERAYGEASSFYHLKLVVIEKELKRRMKEQ